MTHNVTYSIGLVEGYLESLVKSGELGADVALEHFHIFEAVYSDAISQARLNEKKLREIQLNLDGYGKI